jgi:O-antigen ligase
MTTLVPILYVSLVHLSIAHRLPQLAPYRVMLILAIAGALISVFSIVVQQLSLRTPQFILLVGFIASIGVSRAMNGWFGGVHLGILDFLPDAIVLLLVAANCYTVKRLRWFVAVLALTALFQVWQGYRAYASGDPEHPLIYEDKRIVDRSGPQWIIETTLRVRALGILNDPNDFAQYLVTMLPLLIVFWRPKKWLRNTLLVLLPAAVLLFGVYLTHSRGALVGLAFLTLLACKDRLGRIGSGVVVGIVILGFIILDFSGGRAISIAGGKDRLDIWSDGLGMFKSSPLWGIGYRAFTDYSSHTAHNSFLLALTELGLFGYFFWIGMIVVTIRQLRMLRKPQPGVKLNPELTRWAQILHVAFGTYLATCWFLSRTYAPLFYVLVAMAMALVEVQRRSSPKSVQVSVSAPARRPTLSWPFVTVGLQVVSVIVLYVSVRLRGFL